MVPAAVLLLLALVFGPMAYVRWVLARHGADRGDLPGTGGELARHLLDEAGLHHVAVEPTDEGDHYDPTALAVRLSPDHLDGRSVTAVAVAAHEVAHAVQHSDGARLFTLRLALMRVVVPLRAIAIALMTVLPFGGAMAGAGHLVLPSILLAVAVFGLSLLVQMVTLPLEFDASFGRALPAIDRGGYLAGADIGAARSVLRAAALTYLASAMLSVLQLARVVR
jgi:uncharacterized protein